MRLRTVLLPLLAVLICIGVGAYASLHGADVPLLQPSGAVGLAERDVLLTTLLLSSIVVIPVFVLLFAFAWMYRASGPRAHEKHAPNWDHDSWYIEAWWWLVPMAIIAVLAAVAWRSTHELDPYQPLASATPPVIVQVVALDWKWLFIYPQQGVASVNELVIPTGTPVHFELTADAPMNSFWVPALGGQIMVMPGMQTQLWLSAQRPGTYDGMSANLSGDGFADMHFAVRAVSAQDFAAWVAQAKESEPLSGATYEALAAPSRKVPVMTYGAVARGLYTAIIMQSMGSAQGMQDALEALPLPAAATSGPATTTANTTMPMPL